MNREIYRISPYWWYYYPINSNRPFDPNTPLVPSHPPHMAIFTGADAINYKYEWLTYKNKGPVKGTPITPVSPTPDGVGFYRHYRGPYGDWSIYYHPDTGAHYIQAPQREKWASLGWERSPLGYPISDGSLLENNFGFYQYFQNGIITWITMNGQNTIAAVWGPIWKSYKKYRILDLGYPLSDEKPTIGGGGGYIYFRPFDVSDSLQDRLLIYKKGHDRAYLVYPGMRAKWQELGGELGSLGFPISEEEERPGYNGGTIQRFEGGSLIWTPSTGTYLEGSSTITNPPTHEPPLPSKPTINASKKDGKLVVNGSNFKPNASIRIRAVVGVIGNETSFYTNSDSNGSFTHEEDLTGVIPGLTIWVSATDGTQVPPSQDKTGFLWSNTASITA